MLSQCLNGRWLLRWNDYQRGRSFHAMNPTEAAPHRWLDAEVPGEVHLDLMRHGLIGDPALATNALSARWVEEMQWNYRRDFDAPDACAAGQRAWLVFEGIDLTAEIWLNGEKIAEHANAFRPLRVEVTGRLKPTGNQLVAHLDSGVFANRDKPSIGMGGEPDHQWLKRPWIRQAQCQFAWDWSPRLLNVGLRGDARLEWTHAPARLEGVVPLVTVTPDLSAGHVVARVFVEGLGQAPVPLQVKASLRREGAPGAEAVAVAQTEFQAVPGSGCHEVTLVVKNPELWWPTGQGSQPLYELAIEASAGGEALPPVVKTIGFRRVRINQNPHPDQGRYFIVEINNRAVFLKGGNFVPADIIPARLDRARYQTLVDRALEANFNCLRVWGGGLYEADDFYDICNRRGVLVWQEFIFACAKYPAHDLDFFNEVLREAEYQVRRLACHPSLFLWCGNNEKEMGEWDWGYEKTNPVHPDHSLFHLSLPRLMKREDPTRPYWPSSPFSPDTENPNADHLGDQHPWSLGFTDTDVRKYRLMECRFPNEGGCMGSVSLPTTMACLPESGPQRAFNSFAWQTHDNAIAFWTEPSAVDTMLDQHFGVKIAGLEIPDWVYWAGLMQSEAYKEYIENFRRRMFDSACAIFWMYNDTWPATRSWTIIDYYLRRTPSFWSVKRSNAPVHVVVSEDGDQVRVWGVNDTAAAFAGNVRYGVFGLAGGYPVDETAAAHIPPGSKALLASFDRQRWTDPASQGAFAWLSDAQGAELARTRLFLPFLKDMTGWAKPGPEHITVRRDGADAVFSSEAFALGVCLDLDGERALADNFFDLYPGREYRMPWPWPDAPAVLRAAAL